MADSYPSYIDDLQRLGYGALGKTNMLGGATGYSYSPAPWNDSLKYGTSYAQGTANMAANKDFSGGIAGAGGPVTMEQIQALQNPMAGDMKRSAIGAISDSYDNADAEAAAHAASGAAFPGSGSGLALQRAQMARGEAQQKADIVTSIDGNTLDRATQLAEDNAARGLSAGVAANGAYNDFISRRGGAQNDLLTTGNLARSYDQEVADAPWTSLTRYLSSLPGGVDSDPTPLWQTLLGAGIGLTGNALSGGLLNGMFSKAA